MDWLDEGMRMCSNDFSRVNFVLGVLVGAGAIAFVLVFIVGNFLKWLFS
jgi:hypothetical protein